MASLDVTQCLALLRWWRLKDTRSFLLLVLVCLFMGGPDLVSAADMSRDLPSKKTISLGDGVGLDLVLISSGSFTMGSSPREPLPLPTRVETCRGRIRIAQVGIAVSGSLVLIFLVATCLPALRKRQRPQISLARMIAVILLMGIAVLGVMDWRAMATELVEVLATYEDGVWRRERLSLFTERPAHTVTISRSFYLGCTEVTQKQFAALMNANPSVFVGEDLPVDSVPYLRAVEFCKRLSVHMGIVARLPNESEWEYACRAGTDTAFFSGETEDDLREVGWYKGNSRGRTHAVKHKNANAWELFDMHGNVPEWCSGGFFNYSSEPQMDCTVKEGSMSFRPTFRGGSCLDEWWLCRSASRSPQQPSTALGPGFRVVVEVSVCEDPARQ